MLKWFKCARDEKILLNGEMLSLKAQEFAHACGFDNLTQLNINCVNKWKAREEIVCKKLYGKIELVDHSCVNEWQNHCFLALFKEFKLEEIFNTDKMGPFYWCMPDKLHVFENEKCRGGKLFKKRLIVLVMVTASMTGEK